MTAAIFIGAIIATVFIIGWRKPGPYDPHDPMGRW